VALLARERKKENQNFSTTKKVIRTSCILIKPADMHACKLLRHQLANGDLERNTNRIDSVVEMENRENVGRGT
jgi:hypothetical protein